MPSAMILQKRTILPLLLSVFLFPGCLQTIAIQSMSGIMNYGFEAFNEESDIQIARESLGGNLKLLEALIKADPENSKLLLFASQGYSSYALAFAEDDSAERARVFYLRGRDFGLRILNQNAKFKAALDKDDSTFRAAVWSFSKEDVPAIFWTAFGWGSYINLTRTESAALADLARVNALMDFVHENNPTYYFGGADIFFGSIQGTMPPMMGGKPELSKSHFEKALAINGGKFLMTYVYYAKTYCVQTQNQELFGELLKKVDDASIDVLPEARLANAVAKRKAKFLQQTTNDLF
ncbi:MAG: TRAP transporter TatT component family protein [Bacteroidota bacterium]